MKMNEIIIRRSSPDHQVGTTTPGYKSIGGPSRPKGPELPPISDRSETRDAPINHRDRVILNKKLELIKDLKMSMEVAAQASTAGNITGITRKSKLAYIDRLTDEYNALYNKKHGLPKYYS